MQHRMKKYTYLCISVAAENLSEKFPAGNLNKLQCKLRKTVGPQKVFLFLLQ
jgi:hypothetical protein